MLPRVLVAAALLAPASADAAVTRSSVLTPADTLYRVYAPTNKEVEQVAVSGVTDGAPGDAVDLLCDDTELKRNVAIEKDGRFATTIPLSAFKPQECTLRALPIKLRPTDLTAFTGPRVAITYFAPEDELVPVGGRDEPAVRDYVVRTGPAVVQGAGGGAIARDVWAVAGALKGIMVDGGTAFTAGGVPLLDQDGRPLAPPGYTGVQAAVHLDERTNDVTVTETEPILRCGHACEETGVRLARTIAFTGRHAVANVRDEWVSEDGRPHRIRLTYLHGVPPQWRFPGRPELAAYTPGQSVPVAGPGTILVPGGALSYDPAPAAFGFADTNLLEDAIEVTSAATVTRTFTVGDVTIAEAPPVPAPARSNELPTVLSQSSDELPRCVVPSVRRGVTLSAVRRKLRKANCDARVVKRRSSVKKGRVIGLATKAGTVRKPGTRIGVKVSRGR